MLIWSAFFISCAALFGLMGLMSVASHAEPFARAGFLVFFCLSAMTSAAGYWTETRLHHHIR